MKGMPVPATRLFLTIVRPSVKSCIAVRPSHSSLVYAGEPVLDKLWRVDRTIFWYIYDHELDWSDRVRLAKTARRFRERHTVWIHAKITKILAPYGLEWGDLKLVQAATDMVISGSVIATIIHQSFRPNDIDLYCYYGMADRAFQYLESITLFHEGDRDDLLHVDKKGIMRIRTLIGPAGRMLRLMETLAADSRKVIAGTFHSSPTRGAIEWDCFSHFEANMVTKGLAMTSPSMLRLAVQNTRDQQRCWEILHKYADRGFKYVFECKGTHDCGRHLDCPVTTRTTVDSGCLTVPLFSGGIPRYIGTAKPVISWSYNAGTCTTGQVHGDGDVHPARGYQGTHFCLSVFVVD